MTEINQQNSSVPSVLNKSSSIQLSKRRIIKNLLIICIGLLLMFTAYNGLSMLQSTMNQEQGIGVTSQAIIYAAFGISALLLPKYAIKKMGCKRTLLLSMTCYIPYVASNFYFNFVTMIPSAILLGLGSSVLWSTQCTYFNEASGIYSVLTLQENRDKRKSAQSDSVYEISKGKESETTSPFTFKKDHETMVIKPLDCRMLQIDVNNKLTVENANKQIKPNENEECLEINELPFNIAESKDWSNDYNNIHCNSMTKKPISNQNIHLEEYAKIVSSVTARFFGLFGLIYRTSDIWSNLMSFYVLQDKNSLDNITENSNCSCGANFCNVESNCFEHNLAGPSQQMRNILTGASVTLAFLGVLLVLLFLDDLEMKEPTVKFSFSFAMATCKFVRARDAVLLFPLSAYIGFQQAFYIGDFTKSYIACAWGVYHVGLVTICYGMAAGISCTVSGFLVKYIGRIAVMLIGATINAGINVYLLVWIPEPEHPSLFFLSAACWGISVGVFWSQLRAYYGVIFKEDQEAAYAGFYLWDSIGYCVAFSYSNYICTYLKIYILLAVSTLGIIGYLATEITHKRKSKELESH